MLQQTTAATVGPYFLRFAERFPTVEALAAAPLDDVLVFWQGLGYYSRARNLHRAAARIAAEGWPQTRAGWEALPGVGAYTAGAVLSLAFGQEEALVDGNVERVFARVTGFDEPRPALTRAAWDWARALIGGERPGDLNEALMDLGATVCTPKNPKCEACPVSVFCVARGTGRAEELPVKAAKPAWREMDYPVEVAIWEESVGLVQQPDGAWWAGFWVLPRRAADGVAVRPVRHTVTVHRLTVLGSVVRYEGADTELRWVRLAEIEDVAMPALDRKVLRMARSQGLI